MTKMFFQKNRNLLALTALLAVGLFACVKTEFDQPLVGGEPVTLTPNITIADLKKLHVSKNGGFDQITDELIIGGEIVMDDSSGNAYKKLYLQDASGGLEIKFNDGYLNSAENLRTGRKIYIRCKDLWLTDYRNMPQLAGGFYVENGTRNAVGLSQAQVRLQVAKGEYVAKPLAPKRVTMLEAQNEALLGTLIQIDNVQFTVCDAGRPYADADTQTDLNRTLDDCKGSNAVLVRSSAYANFARAKTPIGHGSVVGVLGVYSSDYQLYLRNTRDVNMSNNTADRCGGPKGAQTNISAVRAVFTGTKTSAPANTKIKGIVISDRYTNNLNNKNVYVQDASGGILVRFTAAHCFELGDEIEVEASGQELSEFNGLLQLNNVPLSTAAILTSGNTPTARTATVAELLANFNAWESTLVKITGATISGPGTPLGGSKMVTDATGSIAMYTQVNPPNAIPATFAGTLTPSGTVTVTAILSDFNAKQLILRSAADIK